MGVVEQRLPEEVRQLREWWLYEGAKFLFEVMAAQGLQVVPVRVSCGWPSRRALGNGPHVIGQCFAPQVCADGVSQIFISPRIHESIQVLGTLLHELLHAVVGNEYGHGKAFSQPARRLGLVGPPTATSVGPALEPILKTFVEQMGPYPHAPIVVQQQQKKPGSRLRLYECSCEPPFKVRAGRDDLQAICALCEQPFMLVEQDE
jgi:hypothetical protein